MTVLDLPLEKQKALAQKEGMTYEAWVEHNKKLFKRMDEFEKNLKIITFKSREEAEKAGYHPTKWQEPLIPFPA